MPEDPEECPYPDTHNLPENLGSLVCAANVILAVRGDSSHSYQTSLALQPSEYVSTFLFPLKFELTKRNCTVQIFESERNLPGIVVSHWKKARLSHMRHFSIGGTGDKRKLWRKFDGFRDRSCLLLFRIAATDVTN